ncbi:MAG: hypothetical protein AAGA18_08395 [Verrucomicrobiota bacterium]
MDSLDNYGYPDLRELAYTMLVMKVSQIRKTAGSGKSSVDKSMAEFKEKEQELLLQLGTQKEKMGELSEEKEFHEALIDYLQLSEEQAERIDSILGDSATAINKALWIMCCFIHARSIY